MTDDYAEHARKEAYNTLGGALEKGNRIQAEKRPSTGLTDDEFEALTKLSEVHGLFRQKIMEHGAAYESHMRDVVFYIHGLQTIIMSQAAARAHPEDFILLGGTPSDRA